MENGDEENGHLAGQVPCMWFPADHEVLPWAVVGASSHR